MTRGKFSGCKGCYMILILISLCLSPFAYSEDENKPKEETKKESVAQPAADNNSTGATVTNSNNTVQDKAQKRAEEIKNARKDVEIGIRKLLVNGKKMGFSERNSEETKEDQTFQVSGEAKLFWAYTYVLVAGMSSKDRTMIKHIWYYKDKIASVVYLPVRGNKFWTFSNKTVNPGQNGDWRVDVYHLNGEKLKSVKFTVEPGEKTEKSEKTESSGSDE